MNAPTDRFIGMGHAGSCLPGIVGAERAHQRPFETFTSVACAQLSVWHS
jgi:hypothetical protein